MFGTDVLHTVADLMDDAELDVRFREDALDRIREPCKAVNTGDEDVFYATVLKIGQDAEPEVRPFTLGNVHAKEVLVPCLIYGQHVVNRSGFGPSRLFVFGFVVNGIQPNDGIYRVQ